MEVGRDLALVAKAIRAIGDGYGLHLSDYAPLIELMADRARAASDHLLNRVRNHDPVALRLYAAKHDEYWGPVAENIRRHSSELRSLILEHK